MKGKSNKGNCESNCDGYKQIGMDACWACAGDKCKGCESYKRLGYDACYPCSK